MQVLILSRRLDIRLPFGICIFLAVFYNWKYRPLFLNENFDQINDSTPLLSQKLDITKKYHASSLRTNHSIDSILSVINTTNVASYEKLKGLDTLMTPTLDGFCDAMKSRSSASNEPILVKVVTDCYQVFAKSGGGSGNWVLFTYSMRLAALAQGNTYIYFKCNDADLQKSTLLMPWTNGFFLAAEKWNGKKPLIEIPALEDVCGKGYNDMPTTWMIPIIRQELRRMAIGLVGIPHSQHPSSEFATKFISSEYPYDWSHVTNSVYQLPVDGKTAVFPDVQLDDAVLHFRCGDLVKWGHPGYSFPKFHYYAKFIFPNVKSIGIVTNPFEKTGTNRIVDRVKKTGPRCRKLVSALVDYLQNHFPEATIRVHNGPNETLALAYARMVMANQTMSSTSTFSSFPAVATFGTAYIPLPDPEKNDRVPNQWLVRPKPVHDEHITYTNETNLLPSLDLNRIWDKVSDGEAKILRWFQDDEYTLEELNNSAMN